MKQTVNPYGHTTPSKIHTWFRQHRGLLLIYGIGITVIMLQLRSIL